MTPKLMEHSWLNKAWVHISQHRNKQFPEPGIRDVIPHAQERVRVDRQAVWRIYTSLKTHEVIVFI